MKLYKLTDLLKIYTRRGLSRDKVKICHKVVSRETSSGTEIAIITGRRG
jgi:hypothetical protein